MEGCTNRAWSIQPISRFLKNCQNGTFYPMHEIQFLLDQMIKETIVRRSAWSFGHSDPDPSSVRKEEHLYRHAHDQVVTLCSIKVCIVFLCQSDTESSQNSPAYVNRGKTIFLQFRPLDILHKSSSSPQIVTRVSKVVADHDDILTQSRYIVRAPL